jgi:hypothetical protein
MMPEAKISFAGGKKKSGVKFPFQDSGMEVCSDEWNRAASRIRLYPEPQSRDRMPPCIFKISDPFYG